MEGPEQLPVFVTHDGDVFHARADQFGITADGSDFVDALANLKVALRPYFPGRAVPDFEPTGPAADEDYPEAERLADAHIMEEALAVGDEYIPLEEFLAKLDELDASDD